MPQVSGLTFCADLPKAPSLLRVVIFGGKQTSLVAGTLKLRHSRETPGGSQSGMKMADWAVQLSLNESRYSRWACQIESRLAMQRFQASLHQRQQPVQLLLPAVEMGAAMRVGVAELIRRAGLALMSLLMEQKVEEIVGCRSAPNKDRKAYRWGEEDGWRRVDGQKF